jgi:hypothetical protein
VAPSAAWQPITPRGVAAFSYASAGRLFLVELVVAFLAAATIAWFLATAWFPAVREAIRRLPNEGIIRGQQLISPRTSTEQLVEDRFLGIVVDIQQQTQATLSSDVRVEFHRRDFAICSLFGCWIFTYPRGWEIQFNRPELQPWWGAWQTMMLGMATVAVIIMLFASWAVLATAYCLLVYLIAYFNDRELSLGGSWRLASAALLPGAFVVIAAVFAYSVGMLDLVRFLVAAALHMIVPWVYLVTSPLALPRPQARTGKSRNPFAATGPSSGQDEKSTSAS